MRASFFSGIAAGEAKKIRMMNNSIKKKNDGMPCPDCGGMIRRMAYLGGNVYVCEGCQGIGK